MVVSTAGVGGSALPLYTGASSKVLLAFLPPDVVATVEEQMAPSTDSQSIERRAVLRSDLECIRARGFATSISPDGVASIAAPLMDATGGAMAALTVAGPSHRWTMDRIQAFAPILTDAAEQISSQLGYTAAPPSRDSLPKAA
jgi:DNA-binding IclR family transcriptional regulator